MHKAYTKVHYVEMDILGKELAKKEYISFLVMVLIMEKAQFILQAY